MITEIKKRFYTMIFNRLVLTLIAAAVFASGISQAGAQEKAWLNPGDPVPAFSFFDSDGNRIKLSEYAGNTPVVLTFFGTFCVPCKKEIPFLISQSNKGKNFILVLVVTDTGIEETILDYLKKARIKHPYIYDPTGEVVKDFFVTELPHSVYIGKSGAIVSVEKGYTPKKNNELKKLIKTLAEK